MPDSTPKSTIFGPLRTWCRGPAGFLAVSDLVWLSGPELQLPLKGLPYLARTYWLGKDHELGRSIPGFFTRARHLMFFLEDISGRPSYNRHFSRGVSLATDYIRRGFWMPEVLQPDTGVVKIKSTD